MRYKFSTVLLTIGVLFLGIFITSSERTVEAHTGEPTIQVFYLGGPNEGDSGVAQWTINIRRNGPVATQCTVGFQTIDGTATAPADYITASGNLTFLPGEFQKLMSVGIVGDTNFEVDEWFRFAVTGLAGCEGQNAFVDITILDNDIPPAGMSAISMDIGPEGAEGGPYNSTNVFTFRINRIGDLSSPCSFHYSTRDGTALSPEDYSSSAGTFTFAPGQQTAHIPIGVIGEYFSESDETFFMDLNSSAGCVIRNGHYALSTIINDDEWAMFCDSLIEGDATGDAAIRVNDLVRLRLGVLGLDPYLPYGCALRGADINGGCGDGRLDSADVTTLRQWILNGGGQRPICGPMGPPFPL